MNSSLLHSGRMSHEGSKVMSRGTTSARTPKFSLFSEFKFLTRKPTLSESARLIQKRALFRARGPHSLLASCFPLLEMAIINPAFLSLEIFSYRASSILLLALYSLRYSLSAFFFPSFLFFTWLASFSVSGSERCVVILLDVAQVSIFPLSL